MQPAFSYPPEAGAPSPDEKRRVSLDVLLQFVAAVITLVPTFLGLKNKHPLLSYLAIVLGVVVLLWIAKPRAMALVQRVRQRFADRRFAKGQELQLRGLVERFCRRFAGSEDARSFMPIFRSAMVGKIEIANVVGRIIASDYIGSWLACFRQQLKLPAASVDVLVSRCQEFSTIVNSFNRDYVLRAQKELGMVAPLSDHYLDQLEEFREEFAAYLRDLEQWVNAFSAQAQGRTGESRYWGIAPTCVFERAKTFRRPTVAGS